MEAWGKAEPLLVTEAEKGLSSVFFLSGTGSKVFSCLLTELLDSSTRSNDSNRPPPFTKHLPSASPWAKFIT